MAPIHAGRRGLRRDRARTHLIHLADEVHDLLNRAELSDAGEIGAHLRRGFAGYPGQHRDLAQVAEQICAWHRMASPDRALALTRSALAQHAASLLRRRAVSATPSQAMPQS
jgi:hypothetical protein